MYIRIKKAGHHLNWYTSYIGETFWVTKVTPVYYSVKYGDTVRMVHRNDAVENDGKRYVRIISCSNPIMWYNGYEASIFEVAHEEYDAYWVYNKPNAAVPISFIYKHDCEVLE